MAEWEGSGIVTSFTQLQPLAGEPATQSTTIHILHDDRMIYFGIESHDSDPARISRTVTRRDGEVWEDDALALVLDTFHDGNNAYVFMVTSLGTQQDERWADNGRTRDAKWDANWTSAGVVTEDGWSAEVGIPFEAVRFHRRSHRWGFNAVRHIPRNLEQSHWIPGLPEWFRVAYLGSIKGLELNDVVTKKHTAIPDIQLAFTETEEPRGEVGLDLRYSLSSSLGVDLTFNPGTFMFATRTPERMSRRT